MIDIRPERADNATHIGAHRAAPEETNQMKITKKKIIIVLANFVATMIMLVAAIAAVCAFGGLFLGLYAWSAGLTTVAIVAGLAAVKMVIDIDNYEYPVK